MTLLLVLLSCHRVPSPCAGADPCVVASRVARPVEGGSVTLSHALYHPGPPSEGPADPCLPEAWVLTGPRGSQRLVDLCTDGYGGAGLGRDQVEIRDDRLVHTRDGGDAQRWTVRTELGFDPPQILAQTFRFGDPDGGWREARWDPIARTGEQDQANPACGDETWTSAVIPSLPPQTSEPERCALTQTIGDNTVQAWASGTDAVELRLRGPGVTGVVELWERLDDCDARRIRVELLMPEVGSGSGDGISLTRAGDQLRVTLPRRSAGPIGLVWRGPDAAVIYATAEPTLLEAGQLTEPLPLDCAQGPGDPDSALVGI